MHNESKPNGQTCPMPQATLSQRPVAEPSRAQPLLELHPDDVLASPLNRPVVVEDVSRELLPSIERDGILQPGTVRRHPTHSLKYECLIGHRRLLCCRILGRKFLARLIEEPLADADIIRLMLAENVHRADMTFFQIAEAIEQFIRASGCKQGEAAELLNLDESLVSKAMTVSSNLAAALRPLVESGQIGRTTSYLIATLPDHSQQQQLAQRVVEHGLKRDAVARLVKQLKGGKQRPSKSLKLICGGVSMTLTGNPVETLKALITKVGEALKKLERDGLPAELLPALLK